MRKSQRIFFSCLISLLLSISLVAQDIPNSASGRIYRTQRATIENTGVMFVGLSSSLYLDPYQYIARRLGPYNAATNKQTYYDFLRPIGTSNLDLMLDFGFTENLSMSFVVGLMRGQNIPSYANKKTNSKYANDTTGFSINPFSYFKIGFKYMAFSFFKNQLQIAFLAGAFVPTTDRANQPLVPYTESIKHAYLGAAVSFYMGKEGINVENYFKTVASVHANYSVVASIDNPQNISYNSDIPLMLRDVWGQDLIFHGRFAIGGEFPIRSLFPSLPTMFINLEISGQHALNKKLTPFLYSAEDFMYLTFMMRVEPTTYWNIELGADILVYGNARDDTNYNVVDPQDPKTQTGEKYLIRQLSTNAFNYAPVKFFLGCRFDIPYTDPQFYTADAEIHKRVIEDFMDYESGRYEQIFKKIISNNFQIKKLYAYAKKQDTTIKSGKLTLHLKINKGGKSSECALLNSSFYPSDAILELEKRIVETLEEWTYPVGQTDVIIRFLQFEFLETGELYING